MAAELHCLNLNHQAIPVQSGSVTVALATEVLEHIDAVEHLLSEVSRCLASGGRLFASIPNRTSVSRRIENWRSRQSVSHSTWYHPNDWSSADLEGILRAHGLRVMKNYGVGIHIPKFGSALANERLQSVLTRIAPLATLGEDLIVVAVKQ